MKILICTTRMGIGGAETHVLTLSSGLVESGQRVAVVSAGGALVPELEKKGVRHVSAPLDKKDPLSLLRSATVIRKAARGCDIVHVHGRIPSLVCAMLSRDPAFPAVVSTAHGFYDPAPPKGNLTFWGERTVAVSEKVADYLTGVYRLPRDRVEVIRNGAEIPETGRVFPPDGLRCAVCSRVDPDTLPVILRTAGAVRELRAAHPGENISLTVIGSGKSARELEKTAAAANADSPGSVILAGARTDSASYLSGYDVFIGQSRSAIEAAAAGLAVVTLSDAGCGGILSPENAERLLRNNLIPEESDKISLFSSLEELLCDRGLLCRSGGFAREFAGENCDIRNICRQTEQTYRAVLDGRRRGVFLCGYFGAFNAGDEAPLRCVADEIKKRAPKAKVYALTRTVRSADPFYSGITPVFRFDLTAIRAALRDSRLFVLCGGSLIQNVTSSRSLEYYRRLFSLAGKYGCRRMIWGGGIGPLRGKRAERVAVGMLSDCDYAGLRDPDSFAYASRFCENCRPTSDPALFFSASERKTDGGYFIISLRRIKGKNSAAVKNISDAVKEISEKTGLTPRFAALCRADAGICRRAAKSCGAGFADCADPFAAASLIRGARLVIAVRLHASVFARSARIPAVCVSYDPKVAAFAASAGYEALDPDETLRRRLADAALKALGTVPPPLPEAEPTDADAFEKLYALR